MAIIIGDVHGQADKYFKIVQEAHKQNIQTIQIGDLGFKDTYKKLQYKFEHYKIPSEKHVAILGNHDDYDSPPKFSLTSYGNFTKFDVPFFYVRGAYSIDWRSRVPGVSWWANEEIDIQQSWACVDLYKKVRPEVVISHDCPLSVYFFLMSHHYADKSRTNQLLSAMFDLHKPKFWFFGHHHMDKQFKFAGTTFTCLNELSVIQIKKLEDRYELSDILPYNHHKQEK